MWPKQGHLISKQLSGAQKYKIRFVGQLGVRERRLQWDQQKHGREEKEKQGKKKEKKERGHAQMPVSTWKWSEPESTDLAHTRKWNSFFWGGGFCVRVCRADLHVMPEQDHHLFSARSTTPHCAAIAKARLSSLPFCAGTAKRVKAWAAREHWLALSMSRPSHNSVWWTPQSAAQTLSAWTFLLSPPFNTTATKHHITLTLVYKMLSLSSFNPQLSNRTFAKHRTPCIFFTNPCVASANSRTFIKSQL